MLPALIGEVVGTALPSFAGDVDAAYVTGGRCDSTFDGHNLLTRWAPKARAPRGEPRVSNVS